MFACVTAGLATPGVLSGSGYRAAGPPLCGAGASISAAWGSGAAGGTEGAGFRWAQPASSAKIATAVVSFMLHPPAFTSERRQGVHLPLHDLRGPGGVSHRSAGLVKKRAHPGGRATHART